MTLLQERAAARRARRLQLYEATHQDLRLALRELIPGEKVILFGSITQRGQFNDASDIDLALECEPKSMSAAQLMCELEERFTRRVDVVLLPGSRLQEKIRRAGEVWIA